MYCQWARIAYQAEQIDTNWTVRGSNPGGGVIFRTCPGAPPNQLYNWHRIISGRDWEVKQPGNGFDHSPPSTAQVKERVDLYIYPPLGLLHLLLRCTLPFCVFLLHYDEIFANTETCSHQEKFLCILSLFDSILRHILHTIPPRLYTIQTLYLSL